MGVGLQIFDSVGRSVFDSSTSRIPLVFGEFSFTAPKLNGWWNYDNLNYAIYSYTHIDYRLNDSVFDKNRFFIINKSQTNSYNIHSIEKDSVGRITVNVLKNGATFNFLYGIL